MLAGDLIASLTPLLPSRCRRLAGCIIYKTCLLLDYFFGKLCGDTCPLGCLQDTSIFRDANADTNDTSAQPFTASGGNVVTTSGGSIVSSSSVPTTDVPSGGATAAPAVDSAVAAGPAAAADAAVGYGTSTFHVDLMASPGVMTNASGVVFISVNPQENS